MFNIIKLTISNKVGYPLLESKYSYSLSIQFLGGQIESAKSAMSTKPSPFGSAIFIISSTSSSYMCAKFIMYCLNSGVGILPYPCLSSFFSCSSSASFVSVSLNCSSMTSVKRAYVIKPVLSGSIIYFISSKTPSRSTFMSNARIMVLNSLMVT